MMSSINSINGVRDQAIVGSNKPIRNTKSIMLLFLKT